MDNNDLGLWLSVTQIAERKGVSKQGVSQKVARIVADGRLTIKPGRGREKLINLAQYDVAVGDVGDAAREAGASTKAVTELPGTTGARASDGGRFRNEQTREKAYAADLKFIELERARGNLLEVAEFDIVASDAAYRIVDIIENLQARDAEFTAIAIKEGENGMRAALKRVARSMREAVVASMREMADLAKTRAKNNPTGPPPQTPAFPQD
jgi:DNA-binding IscR family transcriptional regulator